MTFAPIVPSSGLVGWNFLKRTADVQQQTLAAQPQFQRDALYYRETLPQIRTAEALVADRRLLNMSLSAFGLQDDINNKYFIQKVLEDGTASADALANRLTDKRYRAFADAFNFDRPEGSRASEPKTVERILSQASRNEFEVAVGQIDESFRLALGLEPALADINKQTISNDSKWFTIMGTPPVRTVFEDALSLPNSIGSLNIDQQLKIFKEKSMAVFGSSDVSTFSDAEIQETVLRRFMLSGEISNVNTISASANALALLTGQF